MCCQSRKTYKKTKVSNFRTILSAMPTSAPTKNLPVCYGCVATAEISVQVTQWEIFQLTLNSKQSASVIFRKAEMAQQSCCHLKIAAIAHRRLCSTLVPVVYLLNISPYYCLQAQLTCHSQFYRKYYGILHACANSVYQALPPLFSSTWE